MSICKDCQEALLRDEAAGDGIYLRPIQSLFKSYLSCPLCAIFHSDLLPYGEASRGLDLHGHLEVRKFVGYVSTLRITIHPMNTWSREFPGSVEYRSFTEEEGPLSSLISGRLIHSYGASEAALSRTATLVKKHVAMGTNGVLPLLPTRVIDVENGWIPNHRVRLVVSNGLRARYATLSHCWGKSANFVTTVENQSARVAGIDTVDMPQTFRDAVTVTLILGLRYLWIDSLCILQGDKKDWEVESSKMGSYYGDSSITIAADCASDDANGFLLMRPPSAIEARGTDVVYTDEVTTFQLDVGDQKCRFYLRKMSQADNCYPNSNPIRWEPLQQRAWALQERCLSKHVLHFGSTQNYLEDHEQKLILFEDGRQNANNNLHWSQLYNGGEPIPFREWYKMIEDFMMRDITDRSDTFPALSGIAQLIGSVSNGTYRAGLWQGDIIRGLLWCNVGGINISARRWKYQSQDYHAPSWSWACASGPVDFRLPRDEDGSTLAAPTISHPIEQPHSFINVLGFSTISAGKDPFGRLEGASLTLNAPVFQVLKLILADYASSELGASITVEISTGVCKSVAWLDIQVEINHWAELAIASRDTELYAVYIACMAGRFKGPGPGWPHSSYGLIVERAPEQHGDVFRRVGMFHRDVRYESPGVPDAAISEATFSDTDRKTITLL